MKETEEKNLDLINSVSIDSQNEDINEEQDENKQDTEKKKCCKFPSAYTILIIFEVFVFLLLYVVPKGKYDTIEYSEGKFIIKSPITKDLVLNATQKVLDDYGIKIELENFEKGYIKKPIAIPNTYHELEDETTNFYNLFIYPIEGLIDAADISFFLLVLGGNLSLLTEIGAFEGGMRALSQITKGREFILFILVFIIISIGGTVFGMAEEILAFYPILMPLFINSRLDGMLSITPLYMGSKIGFLFSTVNPFSVVLGSYSAGINFIDGIVFRVIAFVIGDVITILYFYYYYRKILKDETKSISYDINKKLRKKWLIKEKNEKDKEEKNEKDKEEKKKDKEEKKEEDKEEKKDKDKNGVDEGNEDSTKFTIRQIITLIIFLGSFSGVVVGVVVLGWWFNQMTAGLFLSAILIIIISGKGESFGIDAFEKGGGDFFGVAMVIGIARGINITLDKGKITDTILYSLSNIVSDLPKFVFSFSMLLIFIFLGFFIQSSSAMAVLAMPIFAPLADNIGCSRALVVNAYVFGQNYIGTIAPVGTILLVLQMVGIKFNYWLKFIWPFMIILFIYLVILIIINAFI